jgi:D-alanyl-D-alanine dipeptidase
MPWIKYAWILLLVLVIIACSADERTSTSVAIAYAIEEDSSMVSNQSLEKMEAVHHDFPGWMDMMHIDISLKFDITYASDQNFTGKKIYDCPACLLREKVGEGLIRAAEYAKSLGLGFVIFDCYRPSPYQERLWEVKPDPRYVMPPWKGSNHSRGASVDLTLYDLVSGKALDMGTPYDHLGRESHWDYDKISTEASINRQQLRDIMELAGFKTISTEWWHYDFLGEKYGLESFLWSCD